MAMNTGTLTDVTNFIEHLMTDPQMDFNNIAGCCDDFVEAACKCVIEGCWTWPEIKTLIELF